MKKHKHVFVIGQNNRGLMPTTCRDARHLVKSGKAKVVTKVPYTIKLLYKTGVATQPTEAGVDTGSQHIGVGVKTKNRVLSKSEFALRSTMEIRGLIETKASYRRGRRYRKVRYRHPKYKVHTKRWYSETPVKRNGHLTHWVKEKIEFGSNRKKGWLNPSIQSKVDHHIRIINKYISALPDDTTLRLELAKFDIARMKDPTVHGELYQKGRMYDYENAKSYVFARDNYRCKICNCKAGSKRKDGSIVKIKAHHNNFRSLGATDNPDEMSTICDRCHTPENHQPGGILYDWMIEGKKYARGYRDATHMNIVRSRLLKAFPDAEITYGNITSADRKAMMLPKSHANDAVAIASKGEPVIDEEETIYYQQVRKKKRSLHEANSRKGRKEPNREAKRNPKNTKQVTIKKDGKEITFHLYDRVSLNGKKGWISGFTQKSAYVKDENNNYIKYEGKSYNQVNLSDLVSLSHHNNWLIGAKTAIGK